MVKEYRSYDWLNSLSDGRIMSYGELVKLGAHPQTLRRMVSANLLASPGQGLYQSIDAEFDPFEQFAAISKMAPVSIIWLLSAAQYHEITQVMPTGIFVAVPTAKRSTIATGASFGAEIQVTRLTNELSFSAGIEKITIHGVEVPITTAPRTVFDLWRYSVLNKNLQQRYVKIDEETFYDAMSSYLSKFGEDEGVAGIVQIASEFGALDAMIPHIKSFEAGARMARP